ncbi:PACE efflux transporter [Ideonella livida]|uniref:PACE efflux transporter n=1 Tax=Ideonella livida TaxID=2707176 RepID=A0A7C9PFA0_9BURK|nr:PACE efflux transporter [Ideonella livida]NDY90457.1 PACE efflux transporter [Ideonella livida]
MQGLRRRIVYVTLFETLAIAGSGAAFEAMAGGGWGTSTGLAVATSLIAVAWNFAFNHVFEAWERRQPVKGRSLKRRTAHAVGFELGLILMTVPLIAAWLQVGWWAALVMDLSLVMGFVVYTFCFNWAFDAVFGLPASAL